MRFWRIFQNISIRFVDSVRLSIRKMDLGKGFLTLDNFGLITNVHSQRMLIKLESNVYSILFRLSLLI